LSEDQAYKAMRKLSMNRNKRIGEIAEQVISAAESTGIIRQLKLAASSGLYK